MRSELFLTGLRKGAGSHKPAPERAYALNDEWGLLCRLVCQEQLLGAPSTPAD